MAKQRVARAGHRWQPVTGGRPLRPARTGARTRLAGRLRPARWAVGRWQWPAIALPLGARGRRLALLALVAVAATSGGWWLYQSPLLSIRDVAVKGNVALGQDVLRDAAALEGESIINPDFDGARRRLLGLPLVKDAELGRDWPNGAEITVVERVPWGLWQVGGQRFVIDDEGMVLDRPVPEGAPVIVQTDALVPPRPGDAVDPGAVAVARQLVPTAEQTLGRRVVGLEYSQARGLTAVLAGPAGGELRATFGDTQAYDFKVATLFAILRKAEQEGRVVREVDLRFGDRVAIRAEAAEERQ